MKVKVINKSENKLPSYESVMAAGMDVRADFSRITPENPIKCFGACQFDFKTNILTLSPGSRALIPTGIFTAIPEGYEIQVRPRSGLALKKGLTVLNTPGTIDGDYRGEYGVILINLDPINAQSIENSERIAQLVLNKIEQVEWEETDTLDETERGAGGFGHSGTK